MTSGKRNHDVVENPRASSGSIKTRKDDRTVGLQIPKKTA